MCALNLAWRYDITFQLLNAESLGAKPKVFRIEIHPDEAFEPCFYLSLSLSLSLSLFLSVCQSLSLSPGEQTTGEPVTVEQAFGEETTGEQATGEQAT